MSEGGSAILVPAAQVHDLRLKMATAGLPKGAVSGFELMDSARFGQTQFQERLTFQRGLEGELTRSISSLAAVRSGARPPRAAEPERLLSRAAEAERIGAADAASRPHARPRADRRHRAPGVVERSRDEPEGGQHPRPERHAAHRRRRAAPGAGLDAQQLQYVGQIEAGFTKRIVELVEPIVGRDNLRASVTADVDFSQTEATSEEFKPNQGADASISIRSQQTTEQGAGAGAALASGVPGAASNQPPIAATAPLTGASQPLQGAPSGNAAGAGGRREAVTNYEVDKTVRVTKSATGNVKRLNAAVVVNNRSVTDAKGKTTQVPLTSDEIEKLTALVRESIGFNKDRGDSVKVINAPFKVDPVSNVETPFWKSPELIDLMRAAALPVGLALVAILVFFGLVRPAMKNAFVAAPGAAGAAGNADRRGRRRRAVVSATALAAPAYLRQIEGAKALAKDNPAAVAGIVRGWVGGESAKPRA